MNKELVNYLFSFISDSRKKKFEEVIRWRTRHVTIALEDIYQSHNASAVLRSCDCFGVQDVHIIENKNVYQVNPDVALGSSKWLSLYKYNGHADNTGACINKLKKKGYRIIATTPHGGCEMGEMDITLKTCLFFGTELKGITDTARKHADGFVTIPMFGFTESFNISVSAAICLSMLVSKLHRSAVNWKLSEAEQNEIMLEWLRNTIAKPELIEKEFYSRKK